MDGLAGNDEVADVAPNEQSAELTALRLIDSGDQAFATGDRRAGIERWADAAKTSDHPAIVAMVALRRVHTEGNLGPLWREREWTRALDICSLSEPICRVAHIDRALFVPTFAGGSPDYAKTLLEADPWPTAFNTAVAQRAEFVTSGMPWLESPGTWTANLGFSYGATTSAGLAVRFVHPDLGFTQHRLELSVYGDLSGGWAASGRWTAPSHPPMFVSGAGGYGRMFAWTGNEEGPTAFAAEHGFGEGRAGLRLVDAPVRIWTGGNIRYDNVLSPALSEESTCAGCVGASDLNTATPALVAGGFATASWSPLGERLRITMATEAAGYDYAHWSVAGSVRTHLEAGKFGVTGQAAVHATPLEAEPWFRWPSAGGSDLLRGLPAGRFRDPVLVSAQTEVSYAVVGPLRAAVFFDSAYVDRLAWTAGGGVRLVLPPGRDNTTRLDIGAGPDGWGVVLAWGDAF